MNHVAELLRSRLIPPTSGLASGLLQLGTVLKLNEPPTRKELEIATLYIWLVSHTGMEPSAAVLVLNEIVDKIMEEEEGWSFVLINDEVFGLVGDENMHNARTLYKVTLRPEHVLWSTVVYPSTLLTAVLNAIPEDNGTSSEERTPET